MTVGPSGLVPLSDAAQRLGISWQRAWRLLLTGVLQGQKSGGRWFVTEESIEAYSSESAK